MDGNAGVRKREGDAGSKRKRQRGGGKAEREKAAAAVVGKVAECVQQEVEEDYEGFTEESIAEVMSWLELEIKLASPPLSTSQAGYVTVKGSVESCGPSFSGSGSTVMASVDVRAGAPAPPAVPWPQPGAAAAAEEEVHPAAAAAEEEVVDDEWVAQLLTDGPVAEGQYGGQ